MESIHSDLVKIREKSGLTISDISRKTRIPEHLIKDIEKGTIFENAEKQKTYLRSFVRAYAKTIGIKDDDIIRSLDAYEQGSYAGFLYKKYLHVPGSEPTEGIEGDEQADTTEDDGDFNDSESSTLKPGPTSTIGAEEFSRPDPSRHYNKTTPPPPKIDSVDWAFVGTRLGNINSNVILYLMIILIAGALIIGGFYAFDYYMSEQEAGSDESPSTQVTTPGSTTTAAADTVAVPGFITDASEDTSEISPPPGIRPIPVLPDTLYIVVHAATDKLEPVRILSDVSARRSPYWIEINEAMRFEFLSEIEIQGQLERMALYINGHLIPDIESLDTGDRTVVITRDFLARNPDWFRNPPPPLPANMREPSIIRDRPVF